MQCELDIYSDEEGQRFCYTVSGSSNRFLIFIPGLTDGLYAVKYLPELQRNLDKIGWSLVQFIFASSYNGYGTSSIENDIKHLTLLIDHLIQKYNANSFILHGFSTGCQDSVYFLKTVDQKYKSMIKGVILHAPVSDREYEMTLDEYKDNINMAHSLIKQSNNKPVLIPFHRFEYSIAMTAQRYLSLNSKMSKEDMFSSDLTNDELYHQIGHLRNVPLLIVMCGKDEYVPKHVHKKKLLQRLCRAISEDSDCGNCIQSCIVNEADHYMSNEQCSQQMIEACQRFVRNINQNLAQISKL